jgi:hypothetical protein|tara:strand:- start:571 stop:747 length:177 start_codon:yes stop_codon:yes gene_type:complete
MTKKLKSQVKSKFYYVFWGTATVAVVIGQLYVGSGYRIMAKSFLTVMETIEVVIEPSF